MTDEEAVNAVARELKRARKIFAPFNSAHEGYGVILEEKDELWDEIKRKRQARSKRKMREEAIQLAAMVIRFVVDVC